MKVVILAGGYGTRFSEQTGLRPKPMIEIGQKPILWHIMKTYSFFGFNDFVICLGYKGYMIKEYFINYYFHQSDLTINMENNKVNIHQSFVEPWKVTLVDTGLNTMTGGRLKRIEKYVNNETFFMTYGDGLGNIDLNKLLSFHKKNKKLATVTAVQPSGRFGDLHLDDQNSVIKFKEKPKGNGNWINGGFFVLEPEIFDYIEGDNSVWEQKPLELITKKREIVAYKHKDFWKPMDTLRDQMELEKLWTNNVAPWKIWK